MRMRKIHFTTRTMIVTNADWNVVVWFLVQELEQILFLFLWLPSLPPFFFSLAPALQKRSPKKYWLHPHVGCHRPVESLICDEESNSSVQLQLWLDSEGFLELAKQDKNLYSIISIYPSKEE